MRLPCPCKDALLHISHFDQLLHKWFSVSKEPDKLGLKHSVEMSEKSLLIQVSDKEHFTLDYTFCTRTSAKKCNQHLIG